MMDLSFEPTVVLPTDLFPNARDTGDNLVADNSLSVHNATWFLELLEKCNFDELSAEDRKILEESKLRQKQKHRTAILFQDDANFVLRTKHNMTLDMDKVLASSGNGNNGDPRVWLVREACKNVIQAYRVSIQNAPLRSCVWSALMYRAEYHLKLSGFEDVCIIENNNSNREAMLCVQGHQVSRSNFTKIARQFCDSWKNDH